MHAPKDGCSIHRPHRRSVTHGMLRRGRRHVGSGHRDGRPHEERGGGRRGREGRVTGGIDGQKSYLTVSGTREGQQESPKRNDAAVSKEMCVAPHGEVSGQSGRGTLAARASSATLSVLAKESPSDCDSAFADSSVQHSTAPHWSCCSVVSAALARVTAEILVSIGGSLAVRLPRLDMCAKPEPSTAILPLASLSRK